MRACCLPPLRLLVTEDLVFSTSHDKTAKVWFSDPEEHHAKALIRTFRVRKKEENNRSCIGQRQLPEIL